MDREEHRRNCSLAITKTLALLALAELCLALICVYSGSRGDEALLALSFLGGMITATGSITSFIQACNHCAIAKGYGNGWTIASVLLMLFAFYFGIFVMLPLGVSVNPASFVESIPLFCFGLGALPLYLLPDRGRHGG